MSKRSLRAPFVVTVAAIATASVAMGTTVGCGGDDAPLGSLADGNTLDSSSDGDHSDVAAIDSSIEGETDARESDAPEADAPINPAACPTTDPGLGATHKPCAVPSTSPITCAYQDLCPQRPAGQTQNIYACFDDGSGSHWTLVSKDYVPSCPTVEPTTGDPCPCTIHMAYVACNYGLCEDFSRTYSACKGVDTFDSVWTTVPITCNPPEVDGGTPDGADAPDADAPEAALDG